MARGVRAGRPEFVVPRRHAIVGPHREETVLRSNDREWDLTIDPETVRLFVLKAKALSAELNEDYDDGSEHEVELDGLSRDSHHHDGLAEEESEDLTGEELRELIGDLNVDEAAELIALVWLGRGDYEAAEWGEAVSEARQRDRRKTANYLMGMPMLGTWLEAGLEAIGA
jgi:hypothetical protein